jgi:hypothetical protein
MRSVAAESPHGRGGGPRGRTVEQPRSFGHVLGDVLTQRVLLLREGREVAAGAMPAADRVNVFLERRTPAASSRTSSACAGWSSSTRSSTGRVR